MVKKVVRTFWYIPPFSSLILEREIRKGGRCFKKVVRTKTYVPPTSSLILEREIRKGGRWYVKHVLKLR